MCIEKFSKNIFVLNLKKREDRLEHIKRQLKKIGCDNYSIIECVDGSLVENPTTIKNGAYGLILTYYKIYEEIKNKNLNELIIIEDDCVFDKNFCNEIINFKNNIPEDWSILYFGGNHNTHVGSGGPLRINDYVHKVHSTFSAHCIVIKFQIFEKLIHLLGTYNREADVVLSYLQKEHSSYTTNKKITWQINSYSDIEGTYVNYDSILKDEQ